MQLHDMHPASASTFTTAYTEVYGLFHVTSEDAIVQYVYYVLFGATLGQPLITETLHFSPFYFSPWFISVLFFYFITVKTEKHTGF